MTTTASRAKCATGVLLAAILLSQLGLSSARAEDGNPYSVVFDGPSSLTVEYGQGWSFTAVGSPTAVGVGERYSGRAEMHGAPSGYQPNSWGLYQDSPVYKTLIYVAPSYEQPALPAGTYTIDMYLTISVFETGDLAKSATPATLTVKPAALGIELRFLQDQSNPANAIVTARFTGRFVDEYQSSYFPASGLSPAGTWSISIKDSDGEVAFANSVERTAGDDTLATSFYWPDAQPGEKYTAAAEFSPSGASASNFTVSPSATVSYTAPHTVRPAPASTAPATPAQALPAPAGFGLPLWMLIVVSVLIVGLGALVTVLGITLSRRPKAAAGEVAT